MIMKNPILTIAFVLVSATLLAQSPQGITHQAVIRDTGNELVTNVEIGIQISILQGSPTGTVVYSETHTPTSNAHGLITFIIGQAEEKTGSFDDINWSEGPYFLKTEADPAGGTDYSITGVTQFLSVPYALHAGSSDDNPWLQSGPNIYYDEGNVGIGVDNPEHQLHINAGLKAGAGHFGGSENLLGLGPDFYGGETGLFDIEGDKIIAGKDYTTGVYQYGGTPGSSEGLYINSGNVGIGVDTPEQKLQVAGNAYFVDDDYPVAIAHDLVGGELGLIKVNKDLMIAGILNPGNADPLFQYGGVPGGNEGLFIESGNVGIGTQNPTQMLDIDGLVRIRMGDPGAGKVLTSDADGVASWITPEGVSKWSESGNNIYRDEGNVGIGTSSPSALLHTYGAATGDGNVLFEGEHKMSEPGDPPVGGAGTRMMWYPDKAAFRVGEVNGKQWDKGEIGDWSFASGYSTTAYGSYSTAMGVHTTAPSFAETVLGSYNTTYTAQSANTWDDSDRLFVIGNGIPGSLSNAMTVMKSGNTGLGTDTPTALLHTAGTTTGDGNVLFEGEYKSSDPGDPPAEGGGTRMMWYPDMAAFRVGEVDGNQWDKGQIGVRSFASGLSTTASGHHSTAMGHETTAAGLASTAIGFETQASGDLSTAMGINTIASGSQSTALGVHTTAPSFAETAIGIYNTTYTPESSIDWNDNDRLFVIGNGSDVPSNAMTVLKSGNTGIGTDTPTALLHTFGTETGGGNVLFEGELKDSGHGDPPAEGSGTRMMWYPDKAAFRAGEVDGNQWDKGQIGVSSFASGLSTTASGHYSIAMGYETTAAGFISTAIGLETQASGDWSTAIGTGTIASGDYSFAMGNLTTAPSFAETAIGIYNTTYTPESSIDWNDNDRLFVIGNGSDVPSNAMTVMKNGSVGIGTDSPNMNYKMDIADGDVLIHGITVGRGNNSVISNTVLGGSALLFNTTGENNTAIGRGALTYNTNSNFNTAIGYQAGFYEEAATLENSHNNTFLGANTSFNPMINLVNSTAVGANVHLYQSNTVILGNDADVGINTNQPTQRLDVAGNARIRNISAGTSAGALHYTSDGTLITSASDERMKTNIQPLGNSLSKVLRLQGVSYTWIEDPGLGTRIGMIAQEVENILPELVFTNENDGYKGINYSEITAVLVEAIKEQQAIIESQLMENARMREQLESLHAENEHLRSADDQLSSRIDKLERLMSALSENK